MISIKDRLIIISALYDKSRIYEELIADNDNEEVCKIYAELNQEIKELLYKLTNDTL